MKKVNRIIQNSEEEIKEAFSKNLTELLGKYKKSKIAELMGVSDRQIDKYEKKEAVPGLIPILNLANNLNLPIEKLINNNEELNFNMSSLVVQLGVLIDKMNIIIEEANENQNVSSTSTLHFQINDPRLSQILLSLCYDNRILNEEKYNKRVNELAERYSSMMIYDKQLKDYDDFMDLAYQEYIYQTAKGYIFYGTDDNGNPCMAIDECTSEEIDKLEDEWNKFTDKQKEKWVNLPESEKNKFLEMTWEEKLDYLGK